MLFATQGHAASNESAGEVTADSDYITVATGGSNVKGSWVSLLDPVLYEVAHVVVQFVTIGSVEQLIDVGIADTGGGNETVIIPNLLTSQVATTKFGSTQSYCFPLRIPAGVRIVARGQSSGAASSVTIGITLSSVSPYGIRPFNRVTDYGTDTGTSMGTTCDPGSVIDTVVNTQLVASCANPLKAIVTGIGIGANGRSNTVDWLGAVTAGANDRRVVGWRRFATNINDIAIGGILLGTCFPCDIPAGTKLGFDLQSDATSLADRVMEVAVYGLD